MIRNTVILSLALLLGMFKASAQSQADVVLINGKVATLNDANDMAQAIAVQDNKIIAVGSNRQVLKMKGKRTTIIDAQGHTVIPGLFDSHLHVIRGGRFYNTELRWDGVSTLKRALEMLKEQAQRTPAGQWVRVTGGWNEFQFAEKRLPTLEEINEATGDVPAFILYLYSKAWLNKAGLRQLNIVAGTINPPGGLIEKDNNGDPTGLLVAEPNAFILYSTLARLPELSTEERLNSTRQYIRELNRVGVTAVMDAGGGFQYFPDDYAITDSLNKLDQITLHLPYFLFAQKKGAELSDFERWTGMVSIDHHAENYFVAGGGENLVADAADFENFLFPRPELPATMEANLKTVIQLLVKKRWPFRIHATYNESISRFLKVIEEVNGETPLRQLVWFFDHAETVSEENLKRIKALNGGIAVQHRMAYQGEHFIRRYGKQAALTAPPVKKMLDMGMRVALGTDGTRVASYNPWVALYWITTGKTIGGTTIMDPQQVLDRKTALQLLTKGGYNLIRESGRGIIAAGFTADLAILDKDYFTIDEEAIKTIRAKLTMVNGRIVYGDADYGRFAPPAVPVVPAWSPVQYYGGYHY